jgi:aspartate/methionine/tyrosine aminotransferase
MDWTSLHMKHIPSSATLKIFDLATRLELEGKQIFHFEVGQPDFPTPVNVIEAAIDALRNGKTKYTSSRGIPELLDAIGQKYIERGIAVSGRRNVIVTPGAKMALFMGFLSTIDRGDDVLILTPAWPTYRVMVRNAGATPIDISLGPSYIPDAEYLKESISRSRTCIVINTPNNPTGGVLSKESMKLIYDLATDHDFVIFSDEIYESLIYEGFTHTSMIEIDPALEHTLVINGFSKAYSMTGWRLGYAIANEETINNMIRIQQNTTSCATSFVQYAGVEALSGNQAFVSEMRDAYEHRRDRVVELLNEIEGVSCVNPGGAFYAFPDFSSYHVDSVTLAEMLIRDVGVTCTPGIAFGEDYDSFLRFSYATDLAIIEEGLALVKSYIENLK